MSEQRKARLNRALLSGSEECFDVVCDPCNSEGQQVQATGHCIDCNMNMCVSCIGFHKKFPPVKEHVIRDKSTLQHPQKHGPMVKHSTEDNDSLPGRCQKHQDKPIKFYCNSHSKIGCKECISLGHRSCKDILRIKDVASGVASSDELIKIQADLQMLLARLSSNQSHTNWLKQAMIDSHSQTVADEILETASLVNKEKLDKLDSTISFCESAIEETEELIADLEKKKRKTNNKRLFIAMKNAQSRFCDLADEAGLCFDSSSPERLSCQPEQLSNLLSTLTRRTNILLAKQTANVKAQYQHDIHIKTDRDVEDCAINGTIVLPDGRLALTDEYNMSVKVVDVTKRKVVEQIKLESQPLDLTPITEVEIAVTLYNKRYIQVLSMSPVLSKSYTITVPWVYCGIEHIPDTLILVRQEPTSAVHICDMSGAVLQHVDTDYSGNKLFTRASRIAISPDHGVMHLSDTDEHSVVSLTMDGKLISKYASERLKSPAGITVDDDGHVYVCSVDTNTVHQLSPSGQLVKVLLEERNGIKFPFAIAHSAKHLYISCNTTNPIYCNNLIVYSLGK